VSGDLRVGFAVVNAALVTFGLWCWWFPVRSGWRSWRSLAWFWIVIEIGNGIGHSLLGLSQRGYFPGLVTAPLLVAVAARLAIVQAGEDRHCARRSSPT